MLSVTLAMGLPTNVAQVRLWPGVMRVESSCSDGFTPYEDSHENDPRSMWLPL